MAHPSTLYRFRIDVSDVDRGVYESIDIRVAMHPSETTAFLLTRVLAYVLNLEAGLEFSAEGLAAPDEPAIRRVGAQGALDLWIEIGNPSARKLHKAAKSSSRVKVYTYKDPNVLLQEIHGEKVYHAERIEIFAIPPKFLDRLATTLGRDNPWSVLRSDSTLSVSTGEFSESFELSRIPSLPPVR